ncbi:hypothetical protein CFN78_25515 [Amycolatopsis antarctica]|uniref:Uncharacterized protein n=1 Tax=Amycolatopsis antarctica TaxID=1854586 RepID=A0A263CW21_9PSEU|nr:hypothetical protein [Amycolatopsis antarctica]OZM70291.1 hypothetical protein CFN78_25515 [Amycolatopsis antarctica]
MDAPDRDTALLHLRTAVERSKRQQQVPFARNFLSSTDDTTPPLARLIRGGRGGGTRLKLYLTITMMVTRSPHDIHQPPSSRLWARTLAMADPSAPRRITSNLKWLHNNKFIALTPRAGAIPKITLLDPTGTGDAYVRPLLSGDTYVTLPLDLWNQGWILKLSPTALALLMVIRDVQQTKDAPRYANRQLHDSYQLSWDTWTRASQELVGHALLETTRVPQGGDFDYQRMRNLYRINLERFTSQPTW